MRKRKRYQAGSVTPSADGRYWLGKYRDANGDDRTKLLGKRKGPARISKSDAELKLVDIVKPVNGAVNAATSVTPDVTVQDYIRNVFFPFKRKRWRKLTDESRTDSIELHIIGKFGDRILQSLNRDELQAWMDNLFTVEGKRMAYTTVDHLRWDLKAIFDLAVADGIISRNPIYSGKMLLFVPEDCPRPNQPVMSADDVKCALDVLALRERIIFKLTVLAGMRVSEVFGLRRGSVHKGYADIVQRVCRRNVDKPKTTKSKRQAALSSTVQDDLKVWLESTPDTGPDGWLFPSEKLQTAVGSDNVMARHIRPALKKLGLGWVDYRVMRRTHSTLMKEMRVDPKLVADQQGHGVDTNQNVYTMTSVESRLEAVEALSAFVN